MTCFAPLFCGITFCDVDVVVVTDDCVWITETDVGKDWSRDGLLLLVLIFTMFSGSFCGITFCETMAVVVVGLGAIGVNDTFGGVTYKI